MNLNEQLLKDVEKDLFNGKKLKLGFGNKIGKPRKTESISIKKLINIKGSNAFRVAIICERKCGEDNTISEDYYLTVDDANQFDQTYQNGADRFSDANAIKKIKITDKSKKEIMKEIERILDLLNEEIIDEFNITDMGTPFLPVALLVDDTVQEHFESKGECYSDGISIENYINNCDYITIKRDINDIIVQQGNNQGHCYVIIIRKQNEKSECTDSIYYKIEEGQIKLNIRKISSELGEQILQMLQERFEVKMIGKKEEQNEGREANSNTPNGHATLVNACMMSKSSDLKKAGESIIEGYSTDIQGQNQIK